MKKLTRFSTIIFYICLGIFAVITIGTLIITLGSFVFCDLESVGWLFLFIFIYTFLPVTLILLATLLIDAILLKKLNVKTKIIGWLAFVFAILFMLMMVIPILPVVIRVILVVRRGFNPVWIYLCLEAIFVAFIVLAVLNIKFLAKGIDKLKEEIVV